MAPGLQPHALRRRADGQILESKRAVKAAKGPRSEEERPGWSKSIFSVASVTPRGSAPAKALTRWSTPTLGLGVSIAFLSLLAASGFGYPRSLLD